MHQLRALAPAKINLQLRVVGRRADGYHLLDMVMVPLQFGDEVTVAVDAAGEGEVSVTSDSSAVPLDASNLCYRAAVAMQEAAGRKERVAIHLIKRTPVGAGLGGGSSDAAAVLQALNMLWDLGWGREQLAEIGVRLGADVPFFCWGVPAQVGGIGEKIVPYRRFPKLPILLVNPNVHVATADIFRQFAATQKISTDFHLTPPEPGARTAPNFEQFEDVTAILHNDLESVTRLEFPVIQQIKTRLLEAGAEAALMSGSGPTVFGLFRTEEQRNQAYHALQQCDWWICPTECSGI